MYIEDMYPVSVGSDPEVFVGQHGKIIGSEKVIPRSSLDHVVRDGVQVELHPNSIYGRGTGIAEMQAVFRKLRSLLQKAPNVELVMRQVVDIDQEELDSLGEEAKALGCKPSYNVYGLEGIDTHPVNGRTFLQRSASGHIHLGLAACTMANPYTGVTSHRVVPALDCLLGNTCVLIDRDPRQKERRKLYGLAGEYRTPSYGIEYRTLSNFWLRSPELTEFVYGMAKVAVALCEDSVRGKYNFEEKLYGMLPDYQSIIQAIQENDWDIAWDNWCHVKTFIVNHFPTTAPIHAGNIHEFERFVQLVKEHGLDVFWDSDGQKVLERWDRPTGSWAAFLRGLHL